jgi:hypothetical protein
LKLKKKKANNRFDRDKSLWRAACKKRGKPRANPSLCSGRDLRVKRMLGRQHTKENTMLCRKRKENSVSFSDSSDRNLIFKKRNEDMVDTVTRQKVRHHTVGVPNKRFNLTRGCAARRLSAMLA